MLEFWLINSIVSQIIFKYKNYLLYFKFEPSNADFLLSEKGDIKYWWADIGCSSFVYVRNGGNQPPQVEGCLTVKELVGVTHRRWSVKYEKIFLEEFETVPELLSGLKEYFEFYNFERPHQSLEGKTPAEIYWEREVARKAAWIIQWKTNKSTP
jgi:hypothetical protein